MQARRSTRECRLELGHTAPDWAPQPPAQPQAAAEQTHLPGTEAVHFTRQAEAEAVALAQAAVAKDPDSYIKGRTGTDISKKFSRTHGTFADWPFRFWPTRALRLAEKKRSKGRNLFTWNQARYAELAKELAARELLSDS